MHSFMKPVGLKSCSMLTPLGAEHETMDALIRGVSGLDASRGRFKLRNDLAGVIHHPVLEGNVELREKLIRLAVHVGEVALRRAGIAMERSRDRIELVFGTSLGHLLDEPDSDSISDWAGEVVVVNQSRTLR
ncbi:hypothetical protein PCE31106_03574 [Pandoraea cepalis]|uniref:Uncharacterized protein n=1 Tax=Pandoraea cepalis TaxID=2508294 RepID=A0A5E4X070_9BURK|nr:hypothetical protein PCE31106_03574 [Pandoraea cepalis]